MPHIKVQMYPGRTTEKKEELTQAIEETIKEVLGATSDSISIAIEEVAQEAWKKEVVEKEIQRKPETITKQPGYDLK